MSDLQNSVIQVQDFVAFFFNASVLGISLFWWMVLAKG